MLVELLNAICYFILYTNYGFQLVTLVYAICCSCLIVVAFIDIDHGIINDRFNIIIGICAVVLVIFSNDISWVTRVIGLFSISVPLLIVAILTNGIGEGDIKLFAAIGLLIGWKLNLLTILMASILASIYGISLIIIKKQNGKTQIPFGPFISFAAIIAVLYGNNIINSYLSLIGLS